MREELRVYPVILTQVTNCVLVEVPDMDILTEGKNIQNAIQMARDAIGAKGISMEDAMEDIPKASDVRDINPKEATFAEEGTGIVTLVDVDFAEYRRRNENRTVRRNVTLPSWLNAEAEAAKINVSKVLQEALKEKLQVYR